MSQPNGYYVTKRRREDVLVLTANYVVEQHLYECGNFANTGANGAVIVNLPAAIPGRRHTFYVDTAQNFRVRPAAGEYMTSGAGVVGTVDHLATSNTVGSMIEFTCIETGVWQTTTVVNAGAWTTGVE